MWTTMSRREAVASYVKCIGLGTLCMIILLIMMFL